MMRLGHILQFTAQPNKAQHDASSRSLYLERSEDESDIVNLIGEPWLWCSSAALILIQFTTCPYGSIYKYVPNHLYRQLSRIAQGQIADLGSCYLKVFTTGLTS